ncbi:L-asparaginase [Geosmithia morbida]|uniref:asparaginase n=1 Tax=Geosmithia morbida TaxID=1094350 RepID=A0A9P4YT86_9HYPO|nr:L-asparaginase [Geosmithia morbida]KAF4121387.1 L-asparaginase [Geosmithia morbida]
MALNAIFTSSALFAAAVSAIPAPIPLPLVSRDDQSFNASLPNITIFATGGTIAGSAASSDQTTGYKAGALSIETLIEAVPEIRNISNPSGIQIANVASPSVTDSILMNLTHHVQAAMDDPYCSGVVVTHGTDTLEETAFMLDLTVKTNKPLVIVGAMRPATAISADGPINLLEAVTVAADPAARDRGTMILLSDRISSAFYTTKSNANSLDTFRALEQGYLGVLINIKPLWYTTPSLPLHRPYFNVTEKHDLPKVEILYGYQDVDPTIPKAVVENGAVGLVLAGMGSGGWTDDGNAELEKLFNATGIPIVYSRRPMDGFVEPTGTFGIGGGFLNPQKARIMLQLALSTGYKGKSLRGLFEYI